MRASTRIAASWGQALTHAGTCPGEELHKSHTTARSVTSFSVTSSAKFARPSGLLMASSRKASRTSALPVVGVTRTASTFRPARNNCGGELDFACAGAAGAEDLG